MATQRKERSDWRPAGGLDPPLTGEDRVSPDHGKEPDRLRVTEIFFSLQGESTHQGLPCAFVRMTGCNLRCAWCDTEYAFQGGTTMRIDEILAALEKYPTKRVELTGGEPLLQRGTPVLATRLLERGYTVLCETSGERDIDLLPPGVKRIVDMKAPGSGEVGSNDYQNLARMKPGDELKIVIADRADFDWGLALVRAHAIEGRVPILLAPVHGKVEPRQLAGWILESGLDARLNLQLHKTLWGAEARGV
ncbi:MAG: radical SAM protein [Myxococcota bacterium]